MRKMLSVLLVLAMLFTFAGCASSRENDTEDTVSSINESSVSETTEDTEDAWSSDDVEESTSSSGPSIDYSEIISRHVAIGHLGQDDDFEEYLNVLQPEIVSAAPAEGETIDFSVYYLANLLYKVNLQYTGVNQTISQTMKGVGGTNIEGLLFPSEVEIEKHEEDGTIENIDVYVKEGNLLSDMYYDANYRDGDEDSALYVYNDTIMLVDDTSICIPVVLGDFGYINISYFNSILDNGKGVIDVIPAAFKLVSVEVVDTFVGEYDTYTEDLPTVSRFDYDFPIIDGSYGCAANIQYEKADDYTIVFAGGLEAPDGISFTLRKDGDSKKGTVVRFGLKMLEDLNKDRYAVYAETDTYNVYLRDDSREHFFFVPKDRANYEIHNKNDQFYDGAVLLMEIWNDDEEFTDEEIYAFAKQFSFSLLKPYEYQYGW